MFYIKFLFFLLLGLCLSFYTAKAQNAPSLRWEPALSFTKKVDDRWSYNFSFSGRQRFTNYGEGNKNIKTDRAEIKLFGTYTLFGGRKVTAGYMYRRNNPFEEVQGYEHRITQQYAFITAFNSLRLANKLRIEERFRSDGYSTRLRYAISSDLPLNGKTLDPGEFYFIAGNELVYEFNRLNNELENRFSVGGGKLLQKGRKIQMTVESRFSDLISKATDHIIQFNTVYYFNL